MVGMSDLNSAQENDNAVIMIMSRSKMKRGNKNRFTDKKELVSS